MFFKFFFNNTPIVLTGLSLLSSLCTEVVGIFSIDDLDLNDIFGVDFDLFFNCLELIMVCVIEKIDGCKNSPEN